MNITPSQQEKIEQVKTAFKYRHGLKNFKIEDDTSIISVSGEGETYNTFLHALIGKHGGIRYLREGNTELRGRKAESRLFYTLREMASKGQYIFPVHKPKPEPSIYGIQFYSAGDRKNHGGLYSIGIHRNATTNKYFDWAFPKDNMCGVLFEYSYMSNGGDGIIRIDLPTGERERVTFGYEPRHYLYVRSGVGYEENLTGRLSNRQIIAKVFKAWLKSRNLI